MVGVPAEARSLYVVDNEVSELADREGGQGRHRRGESVMLVL